MSPAAGRVRRAFACALPYTLPICAGFLFLGVSYGFLMGSRGFPFVYPFAMSALIFAGSMEFVTVDLLLAPFDPVAAFLLALMVNARHLFYGIAMLDRFRGLGWKRAYLIFGMCDESFAINSTVDPPADVDRGWFMLFVTLLNQLWWVGGATLGGVLGNVVTFDTTGLDFVLTALFVVLFLEQWLGSREHVPHVAGLVVSAACLALLGPDDFMIPAMVALVALFFATWRLEVPLALGRRRARAPRTAATVEQGALVEQDAPVEQGVAARGPASAPAAAGDSEGGDRP